MREQHDRSTTGPRSQVVLEPSELIGTQLAHSLQRTYVYQSHEVNALLIEAVPSAAFRAFAIAFQIQLSVINGNIVLAGHIEDLLLLGRREYAFYAVEFSGF